MLVVVGWYERRIALGSDLNCDRLSILAVSIVGDYFAAKVSSIFKFGTRCVFRHDNGRLNAKQCTSSGHALCVIPGRPGHDTVTRLFFRQLT